MSDRASSTTDPKAKPAAPAAAQEETAPSTEAKRTPRWLWVPLALFLFFLGFAGWQLTQPKDETIKSGMIGEAMPAITLPAASSTRPGVTPADWQQGRPVLVNIWASWCLPCAAEAPQLEALKARGVPIIGIAIRDKREDVDAFLARYGNPFTHIGADNISATQLAIGSSGVPETFIVDGKGVIRYQHIGDIRPKHIPLLLEQLEEAGK